MDGRNPNRAVRYYGRIGFTSHERELLEKLSEGGDREAQQCGWLKDKYGASWQVIPNVLLEMLTNPDSKKSQRVMKSMLRMKKIDIEELKRAYDR